MLNMIFHQNLSGDYDKLYFFPSGSHLCLMCWCWEDVWLMCCIYMSVNWISIGSGNGLVPAWHQAITWTNAALLSIELLGTKFSEIWIRILSFLFKKMHLKMSSAKMAAILSWEKGLNVYHVFTMGCTILSMKHACSLCCDSLKTKSWHDANFIITGVTQSCCYDRFCAISDLKIGVMTTLGFQYLICCSHDISATHVDSHDIFTHIIQSSFTVTRDTIWLPWCLRTNPKNGTDK